MCDDLEKDLLTKDFNLVGIFLFHFELAFSKMSLSISRYTHIYLRDSISI